MRLGNLFLRFVENPEYNPRAIDFVGVMVANTDSKSGSGRVSANGEGEEEEEGGAGGGEGNEE